MHVFSTVFEALNQKLIFYFFEMIDLQRVCEPKPFVKGLKREDILNLENVKDMV